MDRLGGVELAFWGVAWLLKGLALAGAFSWRVIFGGASSVAQVALPTPLGEPAVTRMTGGLRLSDQGRRDAPMLPTPDR